MAQRNDLRSRRSIMRPQTWSIVLAGGEGERLKPFVRSWLGEAVPKQYCTFTGTRTLLEHTLDRAARIASAERTVTVVARGHERWTRELLGRGHPGLVVRQPANRDTAAGIFLPLTYVRAADPEAVVAILPSDHF